jgi:hypothetical protein
MRGAGNQEGNGRYSGPVATWLNDGKYQDSEER